MPHLSLAQALSPGRLREISVKFMPGSGLCFAITIAAYALEAGERILFGKSWLEALVLAILIGAAVRTAWMPGDRWHAGVNFSAKLLLEVAVVLLGTSVSTATILAAGPLLLLSIALVVATAIALSFGIGRLLRLPVRMALLVACGNSICGNSAIAAVAPVIGADGEEVAASIAFTAVLGVVVVLGLPLLGLALGISGVAYGTLAGLTVYAVPQVIAAAAPLGAVAVQIGTLVKLVRVLMLGPVCLVLSVMAPKAAQESSIADREATAGRPGFSHLVPWFIIGFLVMIVCRSFGLVPRTAIAPIGRLATLLTVVSMAALGLGVDVRTVAKAGGRVTTTVVLSLLMLGAISLVLIHLLRMA